MWGSTVGALLVGQLHGGAHLGLRGMVLFEVARQRAVMAAAVRAVLPPAQRPPSRAADVNVDVVVDIGGGGGQGGGLGSGRGGGGLRVGEGGAGGLALLLRRDLRCELSLLTAAKHPAPHLLHFLLLVVVVIVVVFLLLVLLAVRVARLRVGERGRGGGQGPRGGEVIRYREGQRVRARLFLLHFKIKERQNVAVAAYKLCSIYLYT